MIHDELPDRNWLPLFIRCRQLESQVRSPITEILGDVRKRAEIGIELAEAFSELVGRALHSGAALLLIDGLDEISDEGDRLAFVQQLRTFLAIYPAVAVVMTCRDAGFRNIAGAVSGHCVQRRLADFNNADMRRLTVAWHKEVVGNREEVIAEAVKLAETICRTDRVRRLAQNPLLLTALLLVKRWVGQMPTKRSVLYGKAVEVLLMTWNVEGHEPIDAEEAIPQLEFVAYTMMKDGTQRISVCRLAEILSAARQQMPEILGYTRVSVQDFIQRVELRSSLLMLSGFEIEEGTLRPMYEFRHLTFQEYLTARAISDGHYPDRRDSDTALDLLRPHLQDESWEEVVLLSAVLVGRKVGALVSHLIAEVQEQRPHSDPEMAPAGLLAKCIIDEIQIPPDLLREALKWVARRNEEETLPIHVPDLFQRTSPFIKSDVRHLAMSAMWAVVWLLRAKTSLKAAALAVFKAALVLAFYLRAPWPDNELAQLIATHTGAGENRNQLLQALGAEGAAQLEKISIAEKAIGRSAQAN